MKKWMIAAVTMLAIATSCRAQMRSLFNGHDLNGWHIDVPAMDTNKNVSSPFIVRNGMLVSLANPQGHIITDSVYENYRLVAEYRFPAAPGNCGILVHASTPRVLYKMFPKSIEVQLMHNDAGDFWCIGEDIAVKDMVKRRGEKSTWGAIDGKNRRILNLTDSSEKALGEWNTIIVECVKNKVRVWENGELVNDGYDCTASKGNIAVQAEGAEVEFRKIEIMPITKLTKTL